MMRRHFVWWPLHPAGYIIGGTWSLNFLWFSIFLTWAAKIIILRFGGVKKHQQAGRLFVGFVSGEFVMVSLWGLIGTILGERTYDLSDIQMESGYFCRAYAIEVVVNADLRSLLA